MGCFSLAVGSTWAYVAEIKAILTALLFCKKHGFRHVIVESDSTLAVGWVMLKSNRQWKLLSELNSIDRLMIEVDCLGVFHVFMEGNIDADNLAKQGCDRPSPLSECLCAAVNLS